MTLVMRLATGTASRSRHGTHSGTKTHRLDDDEFKVQDILLLRNVEHLMENKRLNLQVVIGI